MKCSGAALLCSVITVTFFRESYQDVWDPMTNSVATLTKAEGTPAIHHPFCNMVLITSKEGLAPALCFQSNAVPIDISNVYAQTGSQEQGGNTFFSVEQVLGDNSEGIAHSKVTLVILRSPTGKLRSIYHRFLPQPKDFSELQDGNSFVAYGYSKERHQKTYTTMKYTDNIKDDYYHFIMNGNPNPDMIWLGAPIYNSEKKLVAICNGLSEQQGFSSGLKIFNHLRDYLFFRLRISDSTPISWEWIKEIQRHQSCRDEPSARFYEENSLIG